MNETYHSSLYSAETLYEWNFCVSHHYAVFKWPLSICSCAIRSTRSHFQRRFREVCIACLLIMQHPELNTAMPPFFSHGKSSNVFSGANQTRLSVISFLLCHNRFPVCSTPPSPCNTCKCSVPFLKSQKLLQWAGTLRITQDFGRMRIKCIKHDPALHRHDVRCFNIFCGVVDLTAQATLHERLGQIWKSRRLEALTETHRLFHMPAWNPARVVYEDWTGALRHALKLWRWVREVAHQESSEGHINGMHFY